MAGGGVAALKLAILCPQGPNGPQGPTGFPGPKGPPVSNASSWSGSPDVGLFRRRSPAPAPCSLPVGGGGVSREAGSAGRRGCVHCLTLPSWLPSALWGAGTPLLRTAAFSSWVPCEGPGAAVAKRRRRPLDTRKGSLSQSEAGGPPPGPGKAGFPGATVGVRAMPPSQLPARWPPSAFRHAALTSASVFT